MFPEGMPQDNDNSGGRKETNGQIALIIQVKHTDILQMMNLLDNVKAENIWYKYWGDNTFTVAMPNKYTDPG